MRRMLVFLGLIVGFCGPAAASSETLSLDQAISRAIESNKSIAAARAKVNAAAATVEKASGYRMPALHLAEMFSYTDNPAEVFAFTLNQRRFDMNEFFMSDPNNPDGLDTWITRIELMQPVYTGGQLSTRNQQAELMYQAAVSDWRHSIEQVTYEVAQAYANAVKARQYADVIRTARDTTARHVELARQYAAEGMIVRAEVLKAEVYLARMEEELAQAESNAELARAALNFTMGIDQNLRFELGRLPPAPEVSGPAAAWIESAPDLRRDIKARRSELEAGKLEEKAAVSGLKPEVGIVGHYDLYDDMIFGSNGHSGSVMAVARMNIFHGGTDRAAAAEARYRAEAGAQQIDQFAEGIRLQARKAWLDVETARKRHATAERSLEAAKEALKVREERFRQGLDKMIDLLDAETALQGTRVRELVARFDTILSTYRLYLNSGRSLSEALNITLPKEIVQ